MEGDVALALKKSQWVGGRGWFIDVPVEALAGHALAQMPGDVPTAEGAVIVGVVDVTQLEDGRLVVSSELEQRQRGAAVEMLPPEVVEDGPVVRPAPRSPFDESPDAVGIAVTSIGYKAGVGPILSPHPPALSPACYIPWFPSLVCLLLLD